MLHAPVRDGASKAKIERTFLTLKERFIYALDMDAITSLKEFNEKLKDYIRTYNTTFHTGISCQPFERYQNTMNQIRRPQSGEWLDESFLNRITRRVRKDSTVSIDKISYDVPMQFIDANVEIRHRPDDMDTAFLLYDGERYPIRKTDKVANCHTKRQNLPAINYAKAGDDK